MINTIKHKSWWAYVSISHPVITSRHFKHILPLSRASFLPLHPPGPCLCLSFMRSWSWVTRHVFLTSALRHLASVISPASKPLSLVYVLLSTQSVKEEGEKKKQSRDRDVISSHPGWWCEVKHVARTSTLLCHFLCIDTGAGGHGHLSWSRYLQYGRRTEYPGRYSDLEQSRDSLGLITMWLFFLLKALRAMRKSAMMLWGVTPSGHQLFPCFALRWLGE